MTDHQENAARLAAWDRILAVLWNASEDHVRSTRRRFSGYRGSDSRWADDCLTGCRCPQAVLKRGVP